MTAPNLLTESTAIVTGASRGIGAAIARALHDSGARVGLIARDGGTLRDVAGAMTTHAGPEVAVAAADVSDPDEAGAAVESLVDRLGPPSILVNNAGVIDRRSAVEVTSSNWQRVLDTNLRAALTTATAVLPSMTELGHGSIINIASLSAHFGVHGAASYGASKAGLIGLTRALALEWGPSRIRVNAITPGYVTTDLTDRLQRDKRRSRDILRRIPLGRWGDPEDIAGTAVFLASPLAEYVSGQVIVVDGGYSVDG